MTTTERITLPEIPGVRYDLHGQPMWEQDALDATSVEVTDRVHTINDLHIGDAVWYIGEMLGTGEDFDEVISLIHQLRRREVRRRAVLEAAGWSEQLADQYNRAEDLAVIAEHLDMYADLMLTAELPADPAELDPVKLGHVRFSIEAFAGPEVSVPGPLRLLT